MTALAPTWRVLTEARRVRADHPYLRAADAVRTARWRCDAERLEDGDTFEHDGVTCRVRVTPDDYPFDHDFVPKFSAYATPDHVRNTRNDNDSRRLGSEFAYATTPGYGLVERIADYRKRGASRSVARDLAVADMTHEIERWTWDYGPTPYVITVEAIVAGHVLGRASLHGCDLGDDLGDEERYVADIAREIADEAVAEAREAREAICAAPVSA